MSGVSALSAARSSIVSALTSANSCPGDANRFEVIENSAIDSTWAVRTNWYDGGIHPRLDDWSWRRLDSFDADRDDPRIIALLERMRDGCLPDEQPFRCPSVIDTAGDDNDIVEVILSHKRPWQEASVWRRSNDLLVDMIHLQRTRW